MPSTSTAKLKHPKPFGIITLPENIGRLPMPESPYFVLTGNGAMIFKRLHFGWTLTPTKTMATLPKLPEDTEAVLYANCPPVPGALIGMIWGFFRAVWNDIKSEAMVDLYYKEGEGYRPFIPPQSVSVGGVKALRFPEHIQEGWDLVGTIHSHCNFGAYHSSTDTHDADAHDGIHFTMGHVDNNPPELALMFASGGSRWDIEPTSVIDGPIEYATAPTHWHRNLNDKRVLAHYDSLKPKTNTPALYKPPAAPAWRGSEKTPIGHQASWLDDDDAFYGFGYGRPAYGDADKRKTKKKKPKYPTLIEPTDVLSRIIELAEKNKQFAVKLDNNAIFDITNLEYLVDEIWEEHGIRLGVYFNPVSQKADDQPERKS